MITRRDWLRLTTGSLALGVTGGAARLLALAPAKDATIYKSPTCGCCQKWVEHIQKAGYKVTVHDVDDVAVYKQKHGVPDALASCHTGIVTGGYVVEGHVPADLIDKVIAERPKDIRGLAVPGMPQGSPGMETGRVDRYEVVAFLRDGKTRVYARRP